MESSINLKKLEQKSFAAAFQDGLWDLFLGIMALLMAFSAWTNIMNTETLTIRLLSYGILALDVIGFIVIKWRIITPRAGQVRYNAPRMKKMRVMTVILAAVVNLTFLVSLLSGWTGLIDIPMDIPNGSLFVGFLILVVFCLLGFTMSFYRLIFYGLLMGLAEPLSQYLEIHHQMEMASFWAWCIPGLIMTVIGLYLFIRFMRTNPLPEKRPQQGDSH